MSLIIHKKVYREFLNLLEEFKQELSSSDESIYRAIWSDLQQFCQQQLFPLTEDDLAQSIIQQWRSLQTEIQREFRLLNTDMLFLAASRQSKTKEVRFKSIGDRVTRLIRFSQMAKELVEGIEKITP